MIAATGEGTATAYSEGNDGNIIIQSDGTNTGQLKGIPADGLTVNGTVSLVKTFTAGQWYTIGFPFAIEHITGDWNNTGAEELTAYTGDATDDFWLKTVNPDATGFTQVTAKTIAANQGYIIQVPANLGGKPITFTSTATPVLVATTTETALVPHSSHTSGYALTVNPGVSTITKRHATQFAGHYTHGNNGATFTNAAGNLRGNAQHENGRKQRRCSARNIQTHFFDGDGFLPTSYARCRFHFRQIVLLGSMKFFDVRFCRQNSGFQFFGN
ncbi:hypothetical protein FACS189413_19770 [Bacteroidia bacterium]|nr:hypothetical protein FACS189413_19770 [Bacteroidia bacterium]